MRSRFTRILLFIGGSFGQVRRYFTVARFTREGALALSF
jgi:hypothetical protein